MTARWAHVAWFNSALEAEMARELLARDDIPVLIKSDLAGVFGAAFQGSVPSGVELLVPDDAVDAALERLGREAE